MKSLFSIDFVGSEILYISKGGVTMDPWCNHPKESDI